MANTLQCSSSSSLLLIIALIFASSSSSSYSATHFQTLLISSLSPSSFCSTPSVPIRGSNRRQTMHVFHSHGPCSQLAQHRTTTTTAEPSLSEILLQDQLRVGSIQARLAPNPAMENYTTEKVDLVAKSGRSLGSGNYIVTVGLGTPPSNLSLIFDTASDLSWTQCKPCVRSCYEQQDPIFDPSASSSYSNISCTSTNCYQLSSATGNNPGCSGGRTCVYLLQYGDRSFTAGFLSKDQLTVSTDVFPDFLFGCGQNNQGLFGNTAGLLGLGRDPLSVISQTSQKYRKHFSYCLPSTSSSTGHLTLGRSEASRRAKFTSFPRSRGTSFYFVDIISISVGGRQLAINESVFSNGGSIIDSGTVITRLPSSAYSTMSSTFQQLMSRYTSAPAFSILDTCFDFGNLTTVTIPTIAFTFRGGVKVNLAPSGILVAVGPTRACLAFAETNAASDVAIFGNTQQKTLEVVYDVAAGNLAFSPNGCS